MSELIVEVSTSHGGERAWMQKFIESAAIVGADYVKFQSFQTKHLSPKDPQYDWFRKCELSDADHKWLIKECEKAGMKFLTTAYTADRVPFLADLGLKSIKIGSGEGGQRNLLEAVAGRKWTVCLSTGLWTGADMWWALDTLAERHVVLMHTVSEYPTPRASANLGRMNWLSETTGRPVGYSDHTIGKDAALAALGMGAVAVEVHHSLPGAPRRKEWDKDFLDLKRIAEFRDGLAVMQAPHPMLKPEGVERPFVGRWQHA